MPISNPTLARAIATGTYTGNDADGRQIAVGFKCSLVIVQASVATRGIMVPGRTLTDAGTQHNINETAIQYLHATNGFVVERSTATVSLNVAAQVYEYYAIAE